MRHSPGLLVLAATSFVWSGQGPTAEPHGTVNEIMIGIVDPNANTLGFAAFLDPEAAR